MKKCYVYDTFEKKNNNFTSALHIRKWINQKNGFQ